jgi:tRNA-modifying protein YgfZ
MTDAPLLMPLPHRAVIAIGGDDRVAFLHGLVSNDIAALAPGQARYATLLTPQGKFLHDMLVVESDGRLLLDVARNRREDLLRRLKVYKLRSKVTLTDLGEDWGVFASTQRLPSTNGISFADPRHVALGWRLLAPVDSVGKPDIADVTLADTDAWHRLRLPLGIPEPELDIEIEKSTLLEVGMDGLHAIDWQKGCYVGQELTARTKYRGLLKKQIFPVTIEGPLPPAGTVIVTDEGREAGVLRSGLEDRALALLRLDALQTAPDNPTLQPVKLRCGESLVVFTPPATPTP